VQKSNFGMAKLLLDPTPRRYSQTSEDSGDEAGYVGSECTVCYAPFSLHRKRFRCKVCMNSVCNLHSMRRREMQGASARVCDLCERQRYESEIGQEYAGPLELLKSQLSRLRIEIQQQKACIDGKERDIIRVQERCNDNLQSAAQTQERLNRQIEAVHNSTDSQYQHLSLLEQEKVASQQDEQRAKERLTSTILHKAAVNEEVQALTFHVDELNSAVMGMMQKSNRCMYWLQAEKSVCKKCQKTMQEMGASLRSVREYGQGSD